MSMKKAEKTDARKWEKRRKEGKKQGPIKLGHAQVGSA